MIPVVTGFLLVVLVFGSGFIVVCLLVVLVFGSGLVFMVCLLNLLVFESGLLFWVRRLVLLVIQSGLLLTPSFLWDSPLGPRDPSCLMCTSV